MISWLQHLLYTPYPSGLGKDKNVLENVLSGGGGGGGDTHAFFRNQTDLARQRCEIMKVVKYCEHQEGRGEGGGGCRKVLLQMLLGEAPGAPCSPGEHQCDCCLNELESYGVGLYSCLNVKRLAFTLWNLKCDFTVSEFIFTV